MADKTDDTETPEPPHAKSGVTDRTPRFNPDGDERRPGDSATTPLPDAVKAASYPHVKVRGHKWRVGASGLPVPGSSLVIPAGQEVSFDDSSPWTDLELDALHDGEAIVPLNVKTEKPKTDD